MKRFCIVILLVFSGQLYADAQQEIKKYMEDFHSDPASVMRKIPEHLYGKAIFDYDEIYSKGFITIKDELRLELMSDDFSTSSHMRGNDNPAKLVDSGNNVVRNLYKIVDNIPFSHTIPTQPWSDDYWPLYKGSLANRYLESHRWQDYLNYVDSWQNYFTDKVEPVVNYVELRRNKLSPAEKYDLLVGDDNFSFTKSHWKRGKSYFDRSGSVERWMGLCHGWAPASYMFPRPTKSLILKDASNEDLVFYPSDLKALGTALWADANTDINFIGGRCNTKTPEENESGRIINQSCFDNNPGSWHISIVNQLGVSNRSMVFDATYDYQVWNQPLLSYDISYFDPESGDAIDESQVSGSLLPIEDYTLDKFSEFRSNKATHIIGVRMRVGYLLETSPTQREYDNKFFDRVAYVTYHYDLELNSEGDIIGGEWYTQAHPDFLWGPKKNSIAQSYYDINDSDPQWDISQPLPEVWRAKAINSSNYSQPMTGLVAALFELAADNGDSNGGSFEGKLLSAKQSEWKYFLIEVPDNMTKLTVMIQGGEGDADLYVRRNSQPDLSNWNCRPYLAGNNEECSIDNPQDGTWFIGLMGYNNFTNLDLKVEWAR
ncbi:putative pre-peptidase [Shewanella psychrophila]|uniref:Putative pre-peptidase n=1 Tax=Shewanella psychrophila TaxID=225848 RepID=A0A1S6HNY1_9GAMM|nr:pre-peptidase C-terminal domain-containing protein [Shewanella psychrophila]AQS37212.1 putative pre-peptidase [Shewanella psychrophila]